MSKKRIPKPKTPRKSSNSIPEQFRQGNPSIPQQNPSRFLQEQPRWTFSSASKEIFPLPFDESGDGDLRLIIGKLQAFEGMTIQDMLEKKCTENSSLLAKYELKDCVRNLDAECLKYLKKFHGDYDEIYRFRFDNMRRLYALRNENTFALLWWDKEHKVYKA